MTICDDQMSEKFQIPTTWLESISTSSFDEACVFSNLQMCIELKNDISTSLSINECNGLDDINQKYYFGTETLVIKLWQIRICVDYHQEWKQIYMSECHGKNNQQWI